MFLGFKCYLYIVSFQVSITIFICEHCLSRLPNYMTKRLKDTFNKKLLTAKSNIDIYRYLFLQLSCIFVRIYYKTTEVQIIFWIYNFQ